MHWLIAEDPMYMQMGERFRSQRKSESTTELLVVMSVIIAIAIVGCLVYYHRERRKKSLQNCPRFLFRHLCKAHHLNWSERALLSRLARNQQLEQPALLFVEPRRFESNQADGLSMAQHNRLQGIRQRLFRRAASR